MKDRKKRLLSRNTNGMRQWTWSGIPVFGLCAVLVLMSGVGVPAGAAEESALMEDFSGHAQGERPGDPWTVRTGGDGIGTVLVVRDRDERFGGGSNNRVLDYVKHGTGASQALIAEDAFSAEVASIRFRFYQPNDEFDQHSWIILYAGSRSTGNRAQVIDFGRNGNLIGTSARYERGTANEVELIVNNSSDAVLYRRENVLGSGQTDIWINGDLAEQGFSAQHHAKGAVTGIEFNTSGARRHHFVLETLSAEPLNAEPAPIGMAPQPDTHPPITPEKGEKVGVNPPPMIWRVEEGAASYSLELARDSDFSTNRIQVENIDLPFYNHSEVLEEGTWYWRYFVTTEDGERIGPGPVRRFEVTGEALELPVPPTDEILAAMPGHPRIFTTPDELDAFRERRHGPAADAWADVRARADRQLGREPETPGNLVALSERSPEGPTPGMEGRWREGDAVRRQVFHFVDGEPYWSGDYVSGNLSSDAGRANILSFAYLISGDGKYAEAAKKWLLFVADQRIDYHLDDRAQHDSVVYGGVEGGVKNVALSFDRIYDYLDEEERERVLDFVEFHGEAAYGWLRDHQRIHLEYQRSHAQQCMHALLTTTLAVAGHREVFDEWTDYLVRQYVNRIAWTSDDGGYFEGQTYAHKFRWILEGLTAMRTATGLDLFQKPRIRNSGDFWLYCMSLNYWFHHGGDVYSLNWPWGNPADAYITNLLASMNEDPYLQWWSDTVFADPQHIPFQYLSDTDLEPKPPIDIPQAKVFPETGQLAAFDRFYDHLSDRIFFRSSQWGGHSHAHADQNNFVIHSGGEILAADPGYYTYSGDEYHVQWSQATFTHNSILVNGKGQPTRSIEAEGEISEFFHAPDYTFFAGDASRAYEEPLTRFERAIVFIRPGFYVVYDELAADEPAEFTWLLNTFQEAEIEESARRMTVSQQDRRMRVRHVFPAGLSYEQSNERRYPFLTRAWSRFTEAFPEAWHIRVNTEEKEEENRFLALLNTYSEAEGDTVLGGRALENDSSLGVAFREGEVEETVLFRRYLREEGEIYGNGVQSNAAVAAVARDASGAPRRWMVSGGTRLHAGDRRLLRTEEETDASGTLDTPAARALFRIASDREQEMRLFVETKPFRVMVAPPEEPEAATEIPFDWSGGELTLTWPGGDHRILWVDPKAAPGAPLPELTLTVRDGGGDYELPMRTAAAENGEWVAYLEPGVREPGRYRLEAGGDAELLIQDRWTPVESVRGSGSVEGALRYRSEIFVRFAPGEVPENLRAELVDSDSGRIVNLLRNGDFEEGIPDYPPRGWTVIPTRPRADDPDPAEPGWPEWSREDAVEGESSLRFFRPQNRIRLRSQPMRLPKGGEYVLRFQAKGDATEARVRVSGSRNTGGTLRIEPSENWTEYRLETEMAPGYTEIVIDMNAGGEPDQLLWVDDMEFGPVGRRATGD